MRESTKQRLIMIAALAWTTGLFLATRELLDFAIALVCAFGVGLVEGMRYALLLRRAP